MAVDPGDVERLTALATMAVAQVVIHDPDSSDGAREVARDLTVTMHQRLTDLDD